jgi:hypothetical protein
MNLRLAGITLMTLVLVACEVGSDEEAPAELTGVFNAGGVAGVHFATSTTSGTTDAAGTFRYRPGETVFFSIGGIKLGSAPGAAEINPFTLAGVAPPTTELALRRELDRTSRIATPLGRAINIAALLIALDADHNPDNGIDVSAKANALAGVELDMGLPIWAFISTMSRSIPGVTANVPYSRPLVHLYHTLQIRVPAHADTRAETWYPNGPVPSVRFNTYGPDGSHQSQGSDNDDDGSPESLTEWTYGSMGRIESTSMLISPWFGFGPGTRLLEYEFDASGSRTRTVDQSRYDYGLFGVIESRNVYHFTTDEYRHTLSEVLDLDGTNDGIVDSRLTTTFEYDARHNLERLKSESDYELDGIADETMTYSVTYDDRSRMLSVIQEFDIDGDGIADQRNGTSFEYGAGGPGTVREESSWDYDGDGIADGRHFVNSVYDGFGDIVSRIEERDDDGDGVLDGGSRHAFTHDDQRRMTSSESRLDFDADGTFESFNRITLDYDGVGNLLVSNVEYDTSDDGDIDAISTASFEYGASGEMLGATNRAVTYGFFEAVQSSNTTVANDVLPDGVLLLAQRYLDDFRGVLPNYPGASYVDGVAPPFALGGIAIR